MKQGKWGGEIGTLTYLALTQTPSHTLNPDTQEFTQVKRQQLLQPKPFNPKTYLALEEFTHVKRRQLLQLRHEDDSLSKRAFHPVERQHLCAVFCWVWVLGG